MKKGVIFIAGCATLMFVASAASAQSNQQRQERPAPRCEDRPSCTQDNYGHEVRTRINEGVQRTIRNPDERGRVNEARETLECVLRCIDEAVRDGTNRNNRSQQPDD